jgi:hypothetical protein
MFDSYIQLCSCIVRKLIGKQPAIKLVARLVLNKTLDYSRPRQFKSSGLGSVNYHESHIVYDTEGEQSEGICFLESSLF